MKKQEKNKNLVKFKAVPGTDGASFYLDKIDGIYTFNDMIVNTSPTGNCQLFSIGNFSDLIEYVNIHTILKEIKAKAYNKKLLLIDVNDFNVNSVLKLFSKDSILMNSSYVSTTGNRMHIFIINLSFLND